MKTFKCALLALALFLSQHLFAQIVVDNTSNTPTDLVNNVLLGNGVTASNITFLGDLNQIGFFDGTNSNIGLASGVIMGSGDVTLAPGPNTQGGGTQGGGNFGVNDSDLDVLISPNTTNDRAALEFDFVPTGDSVKFRFVFASEEYDEYVCGTVNDAFGFFLSGPGITGPYTSPGAFPNGSVNLATVPGGNIPISINTVNLGVAGMFGQAAECAALDPNWTSNNVYYFSNPNGATVEYDGFTVVMTAEAQVQCGQTYHIKIVIADGGDTAFDSGVFLEASSFSSSGLTVETDIDFGSNDSTLYEGCGTATILLTRAGNLAASDSIFMDLSGGVATNGIDHTLIPDTLVFLPGQDSLYLTISAFDDGILEGNELLEIMAITRGACIDDTSFIRIFIADIPPLNLTVSNDTFTTCNDSVQIWASASGGFDILTYTWTGGNFAPGDTSAWVSPAATTTYYVTVADTCNGQSLTDSITITVPIYPPLVVEAGNDTTVYCPETAVEFIASATGGNPPYTWDWNHPAANDSSLSVAPVGGNTYTITVTDFCNVSTTDMVTLTVDYDSIQTGISNDTLVCLGSSVILTASPTDGTLPYSYTWSTGETTPSITVTPAANETYSVTITDLCDISASATATVNVQEIVADFSHSSPVYETNAVIQFLDQSAGNATNWIWDFGNGEGSTDQNPAMAYDPDGDYTVTLIVTDDIGCMDTTSQVVTILPQMLVFAPNSFTPNGDGMNDIFKAEGTNVNTFELLIFNRWGELIFSSESMDIGWDGTYKGLPVEVGSYPYMLRTTSYSDEIYEAVGHVNLIR